MPLDPKNRPLFWMPLLLFAGLLAIALTLPGKLPWHDEITTLQNTRESYSHLATTYYTHKAYILAAKVCTELFGETFTALRLPSILMGLASLAAVYALGALLFRPVVGLASAILLLLHPSFLFHSTDARGYQGAFLFAALTAVFLWRGLSEVRIGVCVIAAVCSFLGLMMHPTAALTYPGLALVGAFLFVRVWRDESEGHERRRRKLLWLLAMTFAAIAILVGPRLWDYFRWGTLLVPSRFNPLSEEAGVEEAVGGPLRSLAGWRLHFAPLVAAEHHDGGIVQFGWLLMIAGLVAGGRPFLLRGLFLVLPLLAPFLFFAAYNPPFLVHRYLYAAAPFGIVLMAWGAFSTAERIAAAIPWENTRRLRRGVEILLLLPLAAVSWGPFRAEIAFSEYGATWMTPVARLAKQDFMSEVKWVIVDELPLWRDQLAFLGVPEEGLRLHRPSEHSENGDPLTELDDRSWVVLKAYSQEPGLQAKLRAHGRLELRIEQGVFFIPRTDLGSATEEVTPAEAEKGRFMQAVAFLDSDSSLDFRFHHSVGEILHKENLPTLGESFRDRGIEGMARMTRWDYPRTFGAYTFTLGEDALRRGEADEAVEWYSQAFGRPQSRVPDYVAFLDKVPPEDRDAAIRSWTFHPRRFSRGLLEALDRASDIKDDYRAYWTFKAAEALDRNGHFAQALPLYEDSVRHGDSLGRSNQRLFQFHLRRGKPMDAARGYIRAIGHPATPAKIYLDLVEAMPESEWARIVALKEFDSKTYTEGLIESLRRDESLSDNEKAFWAERAAKALSSVRLEEESHQIRESFRPVGE